MAEEETVPSKRVSPIPTVIFQKPTIEVSPPQQPKNAAPHVPLLDFDNKNEKVCFIFFSLFT